MTENKSLFQHEWIQRFTLSAAMLTIFAGMMTAAYAYSAVMTIELLPQKLGHFSVDVPDNYYLDEEVSSASKKIYKGPHGTLLTLVSQRSSFTDTADSTVKHVIEAMDKEPTGLVRVQDDSIRISDTGRLELHIYQYMLPQEGYQRTSVRKAVVLLVRSLDHPQDWFFMEVDYTTAGTGPVHLYGLIETLAITVKYDKPSTPAQGE